MTSAGVVTSVPQTQAAAAVVTPVKRALEVAAHGQGDAGAEVQQDTKKMKVEEEEHVSN